MDKKRLRLLRDRMESEVRDNILAFWTRNTVDVENGGFIGAISTPHIPHPESPRSLVLNARILWTFSAAYRLLKDPVYLQTAEHAYDYLIGRFKDPIHGGMYWMLDGSGNVTDPKKQVYGNAFAIYGLSEFFRATGRQEARDEAVSLFLTLDRHANDTIHKGYVEALQQDWTPIADMALSGHDLNAPKSMNTHLHVLEAFTNLLRVWDDPRIREKQRETLLVLIDHIVDPVEDRFQLFFDMGWHPLSDITSYGHDIEGSWLMDEAADVLGDPALKARVVKVAEKMARRALANGTDPVHGGMYDEFHDGRLHDGKVWWVQAEAVVGFIHAFETTGEDAFLEEAFDTWLFTDAYLIDHTYGEWFGATNAEGERNYADSRELLEKVGPWKCPYHNARMCFELIRRLDGILKDLP